MVLVPLSTGGFVPLHARVATGRQVEGEESKWKAAKRCRHR